MPCRAAVYMAWHVACERNVVAAAVAVADIVDSGLFVCDDATIIEHSIQFKCWKRTNNTGSII